MTDIAELGLKIDYANSDRAAASLGRLRSSAGDAENAVAGLINGITKLAFAYGGFRIAQAAVQKLVDSTIESEQAQNKLQAVITATGGAAGVTAKAASDLASSLQKMTTYGDEAIVGGETLLLTFKNIGSDVFPRATEAMLDMATTMGGDLQGAAVQLGKALNDPIQGIAALTRVGITFDDSQKSIIKKLVETGNVAGAQAVILKELEGEMGGTARAARNTLGGALTALGEAFGDLFEANGPKSDELRRSVETLISTITDPAFIANIQATGIALFEAFTYALQAVNAVLDAIKTVNAWLGANGSAGANQPMSEMLDPNQRNALRGDLGASSLYGKRQAGVGDMYSGFSFGADGSMDLAIESTKTYTSVVTDATAAVDKLSWSQNEALAVFEATRTPAEEVQAQLDKLGGLLNSGAIDWDTYSRAVTDATDKISLDTGAMVGKVGDILGSLSSVMQSAGDEQFGVSKSLSIAMAVLKGYEAVTSAYAAGAAIPGGGPITGALYAAAAAAATAAQIAQISATTSRSTSMSGAGAGGSAPAIAAPAAAPARQSTLINLVGNANSQVSLDDVKSLLDRLNEEASSSGMEIVTRYKGE